MLYYDFPSLYAAGKKAGCENLLAAGGKGNGKTFGALRQGLKIFLGMESPEMTGYIIRYARRRKESVKMNTIKNLFRPHEKWLEQVTDGKWNRIVCRGNRFYLALYDGDKQKARMQRECCVCNALSTWETDSGADEGEAGIIVFDEAISREVELRDEFDSLMKYHNNCRRNRMDYYCPLVLLGNTVTRDCTIFENFGIDLWSIDDAEKGHIQYVKNRAGKINAIFEWCGTAQVQENAREYYDRFENDKTKMITDGVFTVGEYKILTCPPVSTTKVLSVCFVQRHFRLVCDFLVYDSTGDILLYMSAPAHVDGCDIYINPEAIACNGNVRNFFEGRAAEIFRDAYITNNIAYDKATTGEKYRSFAMKCIGLQSCIPD